MNCFRCDQNELPLAPLTAYERREYVRQEIVLRVCRACGLEQNHSGRDDPLTPEQAARLAPERSF